jgi:hypothetical protein
MAGIECSIGEPLSGFDLDRWTGGVGAEPETIEDRTYLSWPDHGLDIQLDKAGRIEILFLHAAGHEEYCRFPHPLPCGLRFELSRDEVRGIMGTPDKSGEPAIISVLGSYPAWDVFTARGTRVHVSYCESGPGISLVTLSAP